VSQMRTASLAEGHYVPGAEADMPLSTVPQAPSTAPFNVLEMLGLVVEGLLRKVKYGFIARIIVPNETPVNSLNAFLLQVGHLEAGIADGDKVRRITGAVADLSSSAIAQAVTLRLRFRTVTDVLAGGGLVATGPPDYANLSANCALRSDDGASRSPPAHACEFASSVSATSITLRILGRLLAGAYVLSVSMQTPGTATAAGETPGPWRIVSYEALDASVRVALDYEGQAAGLRINSLLPSAALVTGQFCELEATSSCAVQDRQYQRTGRNDRPGARNNLIFSFSMSVASVPGSFVIRAPLGFAWPAECVVVLHSADVFGAFSTLPTNYTVWPGGVTVAGCRGQDNVVSFQVSHTAGQGFQAGNLYVFRINYVVNPIVTPDENKWTMEFNGEASPTISGFPLWTFSNISLGSHDSQQAVSNFVTLRFSLHNNVPLQGYLDIAAPAGFTIPQKCLVEITDESGAQTFSSNDFSCQGTPVNVGGTAQPTIAAKVYLLRKPLSSASTYVLRLGVQNPAAATVTPGSWAFRTYRKLMWITTSSTYEELDTANLLGFRIHHPVGALMLENLPPVNGLATVRWEFRVQFVEQLYASESVIFEAPEGYKLAVGSGSTSCNQYSLLSGFIVERGSPCSSPCYHESICANNSMTWTLHKCPSYAGLRYRSGSLCLPAESVLRFTLETRNPAETPTSNYFFLQHESLQGRVLSSGKVGAYSIVPLLASVEAQPYPAGPLNIASYAVGSESAVRIRFVARTGGATTIRISGHVGGGSFRFSQASPEDGSSAAALTLHERRADYLIFSMRQTIQAGEQVAILLKFMQSPSQHGVSLWNITTYESYNSVLGPMIKVNEMLDAPGFRVLGYIAVLATSSLTPKLYGHQSALAELHFQTSVLVPSADQVVITAPQNYGFKAAQLLPGSSLQVSNTSLELGGRRLLLRLATRLVPDATATVLVELSLPQAEQAERNWIFEAQRVADGSLYATNDQQFAGFSLEWRVSFTVQPLLHAPQARSTLILAFDQERTLSGLDYPNPTSVRYDLTAPEHFNFPSKCFSSAEQVKVDSSQGLFAQCSGVSRTANLISTTPRRIRGTQATLKVELIVDLPPETPYLNQWTLVFFLASSSVHSGYGQTEGFNIVPMPISFHGNNQLGSTAMYYFTFRPYSAVLSGWEVRFVAPASQGYEVTCWGLRKGTLPMFPVCRKVLVEEAVALTIPEGGALIAGTNYTVGIKVTNAARFVPGPMNLWSVVIRDSPGNIQDANYEVKGLELRSLHLSVPDRVIYEQGQDGVGVVTIVITVSRDLASGTLSRFLISPPQGFTITGNKTSPSLPLASQLEGDGGALSVPLSDSKPLTRGSYVVQMIGDAALGGAAGVVWLFQAFQGSEAKYQQALAWLA